MRGSRHGAISLRYEDMVIFRACKCVYEVSSGGLSGIFNFSSLLLWLKSVGILMIFRDHDRDIPVSKSGLSLNKACSSATFSSKWRV